MELVKEYLDNQNTRQPHRKRPLPKSVVLHHTGTISPMYYEQQVTESGATDTHYHVSQGIESFREDFRVTSKLEKANDRAIKKFETARSYFAANAISALAGNVFFVLSGSTSGIGLLGVTLIGILLACLIGSFFYMKKKKEVMEKSHKDLKHELDRIIKEASNAQAVVLQNNAQVEILRREPKPPRGPEPRWVRG